MDSAIGVKVLWRDGAKVLLCDDANVQLPVNAGLSVMRPLTFRLPWWWWYLLPSNYADGDDTSNLPSTLVYRWWDLSPSVYAGFSVMIPLTFRLRWFISDETSYLPSTLVYRWWYLLPSVYASLSMMRPLTFRLRWFIGDETSYLPSTLMLAAAVTSIWEYFSFKILNLIKLIVLQCN